MSHHQHQHHPINHLPHQTPLKPPSSPPLYHPSSPLPSFSFVASDDDIFAIDDDDAFEASDAQAQQQLISTLLSSPPHNAATPTGAAATTSSHHHQVRFVSYPYYLPLSPSFDSSSYVTINGNEETCGSSFSEACSLMASFDTCGVRFPDAFSGFRNHVLFGDTFNSRDAVVADAEEDVWDWSDFLEEESF